MSTNKNLNKMTKKQLIAFYEAKMQIAMSKVKQKKAILISTNKNSIMHIATNNDIIEALRNSKKATEFIISDKFEENVTKQNLSCEVVRVTDSFKDFCRNAIIEKLNKE